jgi:hypothetical protein
MTETTQGNQGKGEDIGLAIVISLDGNRSRSVGRGSFIFSLQEPHSRMS